MRALLTFAVLCALASCARTPQPVHFFAEGRPAKLSDWQLVYADSGTLALNAGVVPYDLNTPLFSDYAHKLRTVWMPKGAAAKYDSEESFDFPVGTIITKTFYYPLPEKADRAQVAVARTYDQSHDFVATGIAESGLNLANVRLIETRVLVRRKDGWEAMPYVWNAAQTEAELARTGDAMPLELVGDDGMHETFTYVVPNENQCAGCHVPPSFTEPGYAIHKPEEVGVDSFQADRSPTHGYRTAPLAGLWAHPKGGFYHDGRFATLGDVINHYDRLLGLSLSAAEKQNLVHFLLSI